MGSLARVVVIVAVILGLAALVRPDVALRLVGAGRPPVGPCERPITYHLGEIDPGFELERAAVDAALEDAVAMWEQASDEPLFRRTSGKGMSVRLVYDERQARAQQREQHRSQLASAKEELAAKREALAARGRELEQAWQAYKQRQEAYEQKRAAHQAKVEAWNSGELERTRARRERLNETGQALEAKAATLKRRHETLEQRRRSLKREREAFQDRIKGYNRRVAQSNEAAEARQGFQMGRYERDGRDRRIRVYKAVNEAELRLVLAHELGHALGIEHVSADTAVMSAAMGQANRGRQTVSSADRRALDGVCR
jgi:hypothetical protein